MIQSQRWPLESPYRSWCCIQCDALGDFVSVVIFIISQAAAADNTPQEWGKNTQNSFAVMLTICKMLTNDSAKWTIHQWLIKLRSCHFQLCSVTATTGCDILEYFTLDLPCPITGVPENSQKSLLYYFSAMNSLHTDTHARTRAREQRCV